MSEMTPKPPAGWYDDPEMVNTRRYWDGAKWTEHRQEGPGIESAVQGTAQADDATVDLPRRNGRGWLIVGIVFIAVVVVGSILGNSGNSDSGGTDSGSTTPSKYDQTWSKDYASTTCDEWTNSMDPQQRFAAAADMLTGARNKGDGGTGLPDDSLVQSFESDVDEACVIPTSSLAEIGASVYLVGRSTYRP